MSKRSTARRRGLALAALVACTTTGALVAPVSDGAASPESGVTMAGSGVRQSLRYGARLRIAGHVTPGAPGRTISLERSQGGSAFTRVAAVSTTASGAYRFAVTPRGSGSYRAVSDTGAVSAPRRVTVEAAIRARFTRHVLGGRVAKVRGKLLPGRGRTAAIQVRTRKGWKTVDRARARRGGHFTGTWRPSRPGTYRIRVRFSGDRTVGAAASKPRRLSVYRAAAASWYGPGLYGNRLGCGGRLSTATLGVANKSLPCGTRVKLHYRGRSVTVPVVDRGPYVGNREWDLTAATKAKLGFPSTGTVWSTR